MSASYRTVRIPNIGTTGVVVSASHSSRRTIKNVGSTVLELVEAAGAAFGTGYPLDPGAAFNFDDAGNMNGPIFVASASAGGACAVIGY